MRELTAPMVGETPFDDVHNYPNLENLSFSFHESSTKNRCPEYNVSCEESLMRVQISDFKDP